MNKIKCRLCNKEYGIKQFGMHVSKTHKISYKNYAEKYWEDLPNWSPCPECGNICKDTYCSAECYKTGHPKFLKKRESKPRNQDSNKKISIAAKTRLKDKTKHPMFGKTHTKCSKEKMSESQKERLKKCGHWANGVVRSAEYKQKMSILMKGKLIGEKNGMYGKTHTPETIEKIFAHKQMNRLEKKVAEYLDEHNIEYTFQFFINEGDVCKSYDFKLKNSNSIIEINGDYWHGGNGVKKHHKDVESTIENDKLKKELAEKKGYKVYVFWEHELKNDMSILTSIL